MEVYPIFCQEAKHSPSRTHVHTQFIVRMHAVIMNMDGILVPWRMTSINQLMYIILHKVKFTSIFIKYQMSILRDSNVTYFDKVMAFCISYLR